MNSYFKLSDESDLILQVINQQEDTIKSVWIVERIMAGKNIRKTSIVLI